MRTRFRYADLPVSRWRNGGGETREIISYPSGTADFAWRASIATIASSGAFSCFPGVDRVITLLRGSNVQLTHGAVTHELTPLSPWSFSGEWAIHAALHGESEDFNIMTRRDSWEAQVRIASEAVSSLHGIAWVTAGEWRLASGEKLSAAEGVWWLDEETALTPVTAKAQLLMTRLSRVL
ncbi:HutD family protein [Pantoea sp. KPR_PJ]|uniref:HutD/Ves family protein n=1 Tax=Pantoea sp. KPR_PJ TaxID=2738375 RepID=UPI0035291410